MPETRRLQESRQHLASAGSMYRLLARLWVRELDRSLLATVSKPPLRDHYLHAGGWLPSSGDDYFLEGLAVDYCGLFLGPTRHLPPFQSVWETGQFQGQCAASMNQFIDVTGYDATRLTSRLMVDHLGVQLDVMGHILAGGSGERLEPSHRRALDEIRHRYFVMHLVWPERLLTAAIARAQSEFYRAMLRLTLGFLGSERWFYPSSTPATD